MKKNVLAITFCSFICLCSFSQQINSVTIVPANPTTADTIHIFVTCTFPNSGCNPEPANVSQAGNNIFADVLHCLGANLAICTYIDTITLLPQASGSYNFYFTLNSGYGASPCTPGIVPNDEDTTSFNVSLSSGISGAGSPLKNFYAYFDPENNTSFINFTTEKAEVTSIVIYDIIGKEIRNLTYTPQSTGKHTLPVYMNNVVPGIYIVRIKTTSAGESSVRIKITD